jgi:hypothetical protein
VTEDNISVAGGKGSAGVDTDSHRQRREETKETTELGSGEGAPTRSGTRPGQDDVIGVDNIGR